MAEINYSYRPKKICSKCNKEIPYLLSVESGKKFRCPLCNQIVEYKDCIIFHEGDETNGRPVS